jgi:hypothetical protein
LSKGVYAYQNLASPAFASVTLSSRCRSPRAELRAALRTAPAGLSFSISFPETSSREPLDGRVLLLVSTDNSQEPRFQINEDLNTQQVFGLDVEGLKPGQEAG